MFGRTLLLLGVVHADFEDGRPLVAQQSDSAGGRVQLVNAAAAILIPKQEVFVVAQPEGVVQLLTLVHRLAVRETQRVLINRQQRPPLQITAGDETRRDRLPLFSATSRFS